MDKCPNDNILADYIAGNPANKKDIEKHLSDCKACLEKVSSALKIGTLYNENKLPAAEPAITEKTKEMLSKQIRPVSKHGKNKNLWLAATIIAFITSFIFPRYFLQCLVATILLGIKWIAESENIRTMILVLDSWRKHENSRDDEIAHRLNKRNNTLLK
ncbi:MAG: hypothetical protein COW11_05880 [Candidatus Omnitrophica bacterium CG12_big_fil_rev_8_21_14_0_65_43_15]|uniref:Zinc-finger domain-containing protein n=1 Tax=Candidatus Taenaricola geysiri TaxID=1974752 RepID=A0A2J0LFF5_9BACT|nr:MAG: hypothetical protein AUJ89_05870 [Candidatus Omnitrophica bacterium CG1_02_43_210]PIR66085.1 MAG: hypothetical protein COU52_00690 [Candidatus Omnitrophica bacterium CG10_big_fil_rev_8_21_14_0_10_43_8]PIV12385.1 MAG: hypothetical protein COS48_01030 [Candidatus Omnitrophica bacterium CG03_land_8_20_14_0_80_43_22]PIW65949.1 MAG: hypothetical protein COW11_05880 [Candidatus Omnitrophica bacterium CG12_big_fil_rev_8_21_14_0_65_43_15]PIW80153.1 MAG: hypothetical protein COZ98_03825 [Candida